MILNWIQLTRKKVFLYLILLYSTFLHGDTLSNALSLIEDNKQSKIENYGVVSVGIQGSTINVLADDIEVEDGIMKKLDVHLYGYSLYSKTSSNYLDFQFFTPSWETDHFGNNRLNLEYKSLDYSGLTNGKIESFVGALNSDMGGAVELDLLRFDYTTMSQNNIDNYSSYYLVGYGGRMYSEENYLIERIATRGKLPYDVKFSFFEKSGLYVGYGWADGANPNALFQYAKDDSGEYTNKGFVYTYELNPSVFFTFPLGYVKLQYQYRFSLADAITTNGFNTSLAIIF